LSSPGNPTPAYLFRRYLADRLLRTVSTGRFLEIGVGSGKFYKELERRGFSGICLDLNEDLIQDHQQRRGHAGSAVVFQSRDFFLLQEQFDLVVAFEVLEHYEDDKICLSKWANLLVPAHMRQWTHNDTQAGHARRYEKAELIRKLAAAQLYLEEFWCYGFPILNLTYPLSSLFLTSQKEKVGPTPREGPIGGDRALTELPANRDGENAKSYARDFARTSQSGRRKFSRGSSWLFQECFWMPFLQLQRAFLRTDLGTGYIVKCRRE